MTGEPTMSVIDLIEWHIEYLYGTEDELVTQDLRYVVQDEKPGRGLCSRYSFQSAAKANKYFVEL